MMVHIQDPRAWEAEAGELQGQLQPHNSTQPGYSLPQKKKKRGGEI